MQKYLHHRRLKTGTVMAFRLMSPQTSPVYCAVAGTIFGTTDVYELEFSYLSISIFNVNVAKITCTFEL